MQEKPNLAGLMEWGSKIWVKRLDMQKLEPWALEAIFVGYNNESKGFRVYWPSRCHISAERDVYFNKNKALLPDTIQIEGETVKRVNSGVITTLIQPKPVKMVTDSNSGVNDLLNAPLNAQIEQKLIEIEPN